MSSNLVRLLAGLDFETVKPETNIGSSILQLLFVVFVFVGVLALAIFATRFLASGKVIKRGTNMEVIESISLGAQTMMQIVRVGGKYLVIGVTKENITFLTEVDEGDVKKHDNGSVVIPFEKYFKRFNKPRENNQNTEGEIK